MALFTEVKTLFYAASDDEEAIDQNIFIDTGACGGELTRPLKFQRLESILDNFELDLVIMISAFFGYSMSSTGC